MASVHRETLTALVKKHGWRAGAELGVDKGILFGMLLRECPDLRLIGVDTFPNAERSKRVPELAKVFGDRAQVFHMTTELAADHVVDDSLDFVFIDADHSRGAVQADIERWRSKVKPGGWLGGHDYSGRFPGVVQAVNRAFKGRIQLWPGTIWGVWC